MPIGVSHCALDGKKSSVWGWGSCIPWSASLGDRLWSLIPMQWRAVLVCMWKRVIFCSRSKIGITWQFWSVAYAERGRVILQCGSILSLLGRRCLFQIFWNISARMRTWVKLWPGCGLRRAARWRPGEETGGPALPRQLWGAPLLGWIALLSPAPGARCPFAHKFSVYCWLSLDLATGKCSGRTLPPMVAARVLQAMLEESTGREVLPLYNTKTTPTILRQG